MAQRLTSARTLFYGVEATEGMEVVGGASNALAFSNLVISPDIAVYPHNVVQAMGSLTAKTGELSNPTLMFTLNMRGGGTVITPEMDALLTAVLSTKVDNSSVSTTLNMVGGLSAGTTTATLTSVTGITAGNALAFDTSGTGVYEIGWVASVNAGANQVTLTDGLVSSVANGNTVRGSITYNPQNTGHGSLSFQVYLDSGDRISFVGCKGSVKLDMPAPSQVGTATFKFQAINWYYTSATAPTPSYSSATPQSLYLMKLGGTSTSIKLSSLELGQSIARKKAQSSTYGTFAQVVRDRRVAGLFQMYDTGSSVGDVQFNPDWTGANVTQLDHQFGISRFNIMAYQVPQAQRTHVEYGDDNGNTTDQVDYQGNIVNGADEVRVAFV